MAGEETSQTLAILDEDVGGYSLTEWRTRNLRLFDLLAGQDLIDPELVPRSAFEHLMRRLLNLRVGAANDPQNAGHVRAQNENVLHFGLMAKVPKRTLTISMTAGMIHDLNKAFREPLRTDEYAVRDGKGHVVPLMLSLAQIVGLNHLGDRTRRELVAATRLPKEPIAEDVARAIDLCIVHHGLGSSRFIQDLIDGRNEWWGEEFVDPKTGERRLVHPPQPGLTLESVVHDLADSAQQMQGGVAWLMKYPAGYWRASGRSFAEMLTGRPEDATASVPMSLEHQIRVESETCRQIIKSGQEAGVVDAAAAEAFGRALEVAIEPSRAWVDASADKLAEPDGRSIYHDIARDDGGTPEQALDKLRDIAPGTSDGDRLEELIWRSGRRLDSYRAQALTDIIHD